MSSLPQTGYIVHLGNDRSRNPVVYMYDPKYHAYVPTYATPNGYNAARTGGISTTTIQGLQQRPSAILARRTNNNAANASVQYLQSGGQSTAVRPSYVVPVGAAAAAVRALGNNQMYRAQPVTPPPPTRQQQQRRGGNVSPYAAITQQQMVNNVRNMNMNVNVNMNVNAYQRRQQQQQFYSRASRQQTPPMQQMQQQQSTSQYSYGSRRSATPPQAQGAEVNGVNGVNNSRYPKLVKGAFYEHPPPPPPTPPPKKKEKPKPKILTAEMWLKQQHEKEQQQLETQILFDELTKNIKGEAEKAEILVKLTIEQQAKKKKDKLLASQRVERQKILQRDLVDEQNNLAQIVQSLQFYTAQFRKAQQMGTQHKIYPEVQNYRNQQQEAIDKINSITKELEEIRYRNRMSQQADLERKIKRTEYGINRNPYAYNHNFNRRYSNKRFNKKYNNKRSY